MKSQTYRIDAPISRRIALLSDLHNRDGNPVLVSLRQYTPDLITIAGDMVMGRGRVPGEEQYLLEAEKRVLPFLRECAKIAPTCVSLGNHEWPLCVEEVEMIVSTGVTVLDNRWVEADGLLIGGLTSGVTVNYRRFREQYYAQYQTGKKYPLPPREPVPKPSQPDIGWLDAFERQKGYKILLSHHPEYWCIREPMLINRKIDLIFSGHAHGGQMRVFGRGLFAPGQGWFPKYTAGIYKGPNGRLVVSPGLSNTAKVIPRLFNPREILYLELG